MKKIFKKVVTIGGTLLMLGATAGMAAAAAYPFPFVEGGVASVAVVYGADAALSDVVAASAVQSNLATTLAAQTASGAAVSTTTVTGGESFKFEKSSTKFHLGDNVTEVVSSSLDDDELPILLTDGEFLDNDNDEFDYTQKITIGPLVQLSMFDDDDYAEDAPTVGFSILSGITVLNYTLDFSDEPLLMDLATTDLPFMGKTYYVLSNSSAGTTNLVLTLLDSASDTILAEGETATLDVEGTSYEASINFISSSEVKLTVNGETTNSLAESDTYKLSDGSYVGIKDIMYTAKDVGISKVEFSIGSGKLTLTSGSEVEINDDIISGLYAYTTNSSGTPITATLSSIVIKWTADEDLFIAEDTAITMPGFEAVKLSYGGLIYPAEETIEVEQGGTIYAVLDNFPLKDGAADIHFLYGDSTSFTGLGKDSGNKLATAASGANLIFDANNVDDYFVVTYASTSDAESYLMRANTFVIDGSDNKTDFEYYKNGAWVDKKTSAKDGDTFSIGNAEILVNTVSKLGSTKTVNITNNSVDTNFYQLYSKEGMRVLLPVVNATAVDIMNATNYSSDATACTAATTAINAHVASGVTLGELYVAKVIYNKTTLNVSTTSTDDCAPGTTFKLILNEEDKDGNKAHADGDSINVTLSWDLSNTPEVEVGTVITENNDVAEVEIGETDVWREFAYSALATELLWNKPTSGQKSLKVIYHGDEVAADVYITSPEAVVTPGTSTTTGTATELGQITVSDSEIASVAGKNLIVIGGSCINSVAAELVGGDYCGEGFTIATEIAAGEALIKSYDRSGKVALLVAGYNAADTTKAVTYLVNQVPDTAVGSALKVTSATEATAITTTA